MNYFHLVLYLIVCPLLLYNSIRQKNIKLFICFVLILGSHLYKEFQDTDWKWPVWTEPIGFIIGYIIQRYSTNNIVKCIGILKMIAHVRQFLLKDDIYYGVN